MKDAKIHVKRKKARSERPKLKIDLPGAHPWVLVATSKGRLFFHNQSTLESTWNQPQEIANLDDIVDNDQLILLIALARGLKLREPETVDEVDQAQEVQEVDQVEAQEANEPQEPQNESQELQESQEESSDEDQVDDSILDALLQDKDADMDDATRRSVFEQMLLDHNVNPYGDWSNELEKVVHDANYNLYLSQRERQQIFDEWSKLQVSRKRDEDTTRSSPEQQFLELVVSNYKPSLFYLHFKRKLRNDPQFVNCTLADSEKEKLFRDYSMLIKSPIDMRINAFTKDVHANKHAIVDNRSLLKTWPSFYALEDDNARQSIIEKHLASVPASKQQDALEKRQQQVLLENSRLERSLNKSRLAHAQERQRVIDSITKVDSAGSIKQQLQNKN